MTIVALTHKVQTQGLTALVVGQLHCHAEQNCRTLQCRYVVLATCQGYHPIGRDSNWIVVDAANCDTTDVHIPMIPLHVSIIIAVKELVPQDQDNIRRWRRQKYGNLSEDLPGVTQVAEDLNFSRVLVRDTDTGAEHKLLALPIEQDGLVEVQHVLSGVLHRTRAHHVFTMRCQPVHDAQRILHGLLCSRYGFSDGCTIDASCEIHVERSSASDAGQS